jgi:hypothetical protein
MERDARTRDPAAAGTEPRPRPGRRALTTTTHYPPTHHE